MDPRDLLRLAGKPGDPHRRALLATASRADAALPVARAWLRRWRPRPMMVEVPPCGCAAGRCPVCN